MKTIGLLGGMSWESTALYYRLINEETRRRLGGLHSAAIAMVSVDFEPVERLQMADDWDAAGELLAARALDVQSAGADFLLLCTNTMHKVASVIESAIDVPMLHLADATAQAIVSAGHKSPGLLGTRFTMEQRFYVERLERAGLTVSVPDDVGRGDVHRVIYDELCQGDIVPASRDRYQAIVQDLQSRGADCIIAGCTEITLLLQPEDIALPLFDTASIHALAAVDRALA